MKCFCSNYQALSNPIHFYHQLFFLYLSCKRGCIDINMLRISCDVPVTFCNFNQN